MHVISIALGYSHTCAILDNKTLKCWGGNNRGELGYSTRVDSLTPTVINVGDSRYAVSIALGVSYTCAILDNTCWGSNNIGQLGDYTTIDRSTPSTLTILNNGRYALNISLGDQHSCAILDDDSIECWGRDTEGQLDGFTVLMNCNSLSSTPSSNLSAVYPYHKQCVICHSFFEANLRPKKCS